MRNCVNIVSLWRCGSFEKRRNEDFTNYALNHFSMNFNSDESFAKQFFVFPPKFCWGYEDDEGVIMNEFSCSDTLFKLLTKLLHTVLRSFLLCSSQPIHATVIQINSYFLWGTTNFHSFCPICISRRFISFFFVILLLLFHLIHNRIRQAHSNQLRRPGVCL